MRPLLVAFVGRADGAWSVERLETVRGTPLALVERLAVLEGAAAARPIAGAAWTLRGVTSNERYVERRELEQRGADPDHEVRCLVGAAAGRAPPDL